VFRASKRIESRLSSDEVKSVENIRFLCHELLLYYSENSSLPKEKEWKKVLIDTYDVKYKFWRAYLKRKLLDSYGTEIKYMIYSNMKEPKVLLTSAGSDKLFYTHDDIVYECKRKKNQSGDNSYIHRVNSMILKKN